MKDSTTEIRKLYEDANRKKIFILIAGIAANIIMGLYFVTIGVADTDFFQVI